MRCGSAFCRASAASPGSISTRCTVTPGDATRQREAGGADAGAEVDRDLAGRRRRRGGQQDGVVPEPVPARGLPQRQPAAERRVVGECG